MHFSGSPDIPKHALDMSKNTPLTSRDGQQSNDA